ncbi:class I SAM-dependent methyltransferase [Chengkuizengella axinellae]|uniref:Class I SAM-dependent methyltransferase n=1 Tax=Chengkuizengella axinellae TaxID=3064388 RepID=A0ABT9J2F8_9BACL|nr:class I SAM-dependent methyltransferase [Chengkuizengella sp. 2205SS18-9]MDP5275772.1 class I SAM-dependent methyltransferase [Chengkuizengella sp. 2205SS18-9]
MDSKKRFSNRVENYVKYRPSYPKKALDFCYEELGFKQDSVIADVGSGTGIFTKLLLERESKVLSVEPNQEMREAAEKLLESYENYTSISGSAENTSLPDHAVDFIVSAQAFHWFDLQKTKKEFERILKPDGEVVLIWNNRLTEESDFLIEYDRLLKTYANDYNEINHQNIGEQEFSTFFNHQGYKVFTCPNYQLFNFEQLKGRLLSSSYSPTPGDQNYEIIMGKLQALFDLYNENGKVTFRYNTEIYYGGV